MQEHANTPALLLVNLGTPAAPTATAVSAYLDEFLSDPRVVQLPRWLWLPLLRKVILPRRSPLVAKKYAEGIVLVQTIEGELAAFALQ